MKIEIIRAIAKSYPCSFRDCEYIYDMFESYDMLIAILEISMASAVCPKHVAQVLKNKKNREKKLFNNG